MKGNWWFDLGEDCQNASGPYDRRRDACAAAENELSGPEDHFFIFQGRKVLVDFAEHFELNEWWIEVSENIEWHDNIRDEEQQTIHPDKLTCIKFEDAVKDAMKKAAKDFGIEKWTGKIDIHENRIYHCQRLQSGELMIDDEL